jgi:hypothetical protein
MVNVGIYGDSFADRAPMHLIDASKGLVPWMDTFKELSNTKITNYARSSTSLWYSFNKFLQTYEEYDIIIFSYSHYTRWNGIKDEYSGLSQLTTGNYFDYPEPLQKAAKAIREASEYLYNDDLNLYLYQKFFDDVNAICKKNNKKLINLMPFELSQGNFRLMSDERYVPHGQVIDLSNRQGPCLLNLFDVSQRENEPFGEIVFPIPSPDPRFCHLSPYNNTIYGTLVHECLLEYNNIDILDVSTDPRFRYIVEDFEYIRNIL